MRHTCPEDWTLVEGGLPEDDGFAAGFKMNGLLFRVIVSWGMGWDHVSVSTRRRCPTWAEMCYVKQAMFEPEEVVVQYHPAESEYVNCHKFCLHLWRPQAAELPIPGWYLVGPRSTA
jgi:hypothetical protein